MHHFFSRYALLSLSLSLSLTRTLNFSLSLWKVCTPLSLCLSLSLSLSCAHSNFHSLFACVCNYYVMSEMCVQFMHGVPETSISSKCAFPCMPNMSLHKEAVLHFLTESKPLPFCTDILKIIVNYLPSPSGDILILRPGDNGRSIIEEYTVHINRTDTGRMVCVNVWRSLWLGMCICRACVYVCGIFVPRHMSCLCVRWCALCFFIKMLRRFC